MALQASSDMDSFESYASSFSINFRVIGNLQRSQKMTPKTAFTQNRDLIVKAIEKKELSDQQLAQLFKNSGVNFRGNFAKEQKVVRALNERTHVVHNDCSYLEKFVQHYIPVKSPEDIEFAGAVETLFPLLADATKNKDCPMLYRIEIVRTKQKVDLVLIFDHDKRTKGGVIGGVGDCRNAVIRYAILRLFGAEGYTEVPGRDDSSDDFKISIHLLKGQEIKMINDISNLLKGGLGNYLIKELVDAGHIYINSWGLSLRETGMVLKMEKKDIKTEEGAKGFCVISGIEEYRMDRVKGFFEEEFGNVQLLDSTTVKIILDGNIANPESNRL